MRGVLTRSIWMSRGSCALPTPTVKTGSLSAFMPSRASPSAASLVSAPSDTSTTPDTGSPASSSRAPSSAGAEPRLRAVERQLVYRIEASGGRREPEHADQEALRQRLDQRAVRARRTAGGRTRRAPGRPSRESACCANRPGARRRRSAAAPRRGRPASGGRGRTATSASAAIRSTVRTMPVAQASLGADAPVGDDRGRP